MIPYAQPLLIESMSAALLVLLAVLWQVWFPFGLWQLLAWSAWWVPIGGLAAVPPVLLIPLLESPLRRRWRWLRVLHDNVTSLLMPLLGHLRWHEMVALAGLAGLSEEVFFRGALQQAIGLVPASLIFGLLHAISIPYMLWATLTGLYLGWLCQLTENLWVPMLTHTVIDCVGLGYLRWGNTPRRACES